MQLFIDPDVDLLFYVFSPEQNIFNASAERGFLPS